MVITCIVLFVILVVVTFISHRNNESEVIEYAKPPRKPLTNAEREAIRQADMAFDYDTRKAIIEDTYNGPLPEHVAFNMWTDLYPDLYNTKIAGINFRRGIKDLAGQYFDCYLETDPKNRYDKNAIKILHVDGRHLGFIPSEETDSVREFIGGMLPYHECRAHITEGEEENEDTGRARHYLIGVINIRKPRK